MSIDNRTWRTEDEGDDEIDNEPKWILTIEINSKINEFDSASEASTYTRPTLLVLQGIISFISGKPLTVFDSFSNLHIKEFISEVPQSTYVNHCTINGIDHRNNLNKLIQVLDPSTDHIKVIASAIDRWRHALFLNWKSEQEEEDINLTIDTVFLTFFHVLELLAEYNFKNEEVNIKSRIRSFCNDLYSDELKLIGGGLRDKANKTAETIEQLVSVDISIGVKIARLISNYDDYTPRLRAFIVNLIEIRNAIAHGRYVYNPRVALLT
jgi:hypothetical protein